MIRLFRRASSKARTRRSRRMPELNDPEIYQSVLDSLETGVYIVDRNRRIRFWNEGAEKITGYLRQDVVGRFLRDHLLTTGNDARDVDSDPDDPINLVFRDGKSSIMDVSISPQGWIPRSHRSSNPTDSQQPRRSRRGFGELWQELFGLGLDSKAVRFCRFWLPGRDDRCSRAEFYGNATARKLDYIRRTQHSVRDSSYTSRSSGSVPGQPRFRCSALDSTGGC